MSTRKRRDPRGLEPESPSLYTDEKKAPPNIVDEVIARFIVTAAPLLIARLFPPQEHRAAPRECSVCAPCPTCHRPRLAHDDGPHGTRVQ